VTFVVVLYTPVLLSSIFIFPDRAAGFLEPNVVFLNQWTLTGAQPDLIPEFLLQVLALVGLLSLVLLVCGVIPSARDALARAGARYIGSPASPALAIVALATIGCVVVCTLARMSSGVFYDRYLLPLIPLVAILVHSARAGRAGSTRWARVAGCISLLGLAGFGIVYAATSASFDGTRWSVARAVAQTTSPTRVDAGFEWNNFHAGTVQYPFTAHPKSACIVLDAETSRLRNGESVVQFRRLWTPLDTDLWIVARQRGPC
jgi:hypothetical protein